MTKTASKAQAATWANVQPGVRPNARPNMTPWTRTLLVFTSVLFGLACGRTPVEPQGLHAPAEGLVDFTKVLPAHQLDWERRLPGKSDAVDDFKQAHPGWYQETVPPAVDGLRAMTEWEPMEGTLLAVTPGLLGDTEVLQTFVAIAQGASSVGKVWFLVDGSAAEQGFVTALVNAGIPAADIGLGRNIEPIPMALDAYWTIDFGPFPLIDASGSVAFLDWRYYWSRYLDDAVPTKLGELWGATTYRMPVNFEGGNFQADGAGTCYTTERGVQYSGVSLNELQTLYRDYVGCETLVVLKDIHDDGTGHIDMFFKLFAEDQAILGSFTASQDSISKADMDDNAAILAGTPLPGGGTMTVWRMPHPNHYDATPRTYLNSTLVNGVNLWPDYSIDKSIEAEAAAVWQQAMPDWQHVPVLSDQISRYSGAVHCVTRTIPALPRTPWVPDGSCNQASGTCDGPTGAFHGACTSDADCVGPEWLCVQTGDCPGVIEDPCGGLTYEGCCDGELTRWCEDGELREANCGDTTEGVHCGWVASEDFYWCGTVGGADPSGAHPMLCPGACQPSCDGVSCGQDDGCGSPCGCTGLDECANGLCLPCAPACAGKTCGPDGCGGSCGECVGALGFCAEDGACVEHPCGDFTWEGCCDGSVVRWCESDEIKSAECLTHATGPACAWSVAEGYYGCGATPTEDPSGQHPRNCDGCASDCSSRECGDDGCGGSCGTCVAGATCGADGLCCTPSCVDASGASMDCGNDGCGASCGQCTGGESCSSGGHCVPACDGIVCGACEHCDSTTATCVPDADGTSCDDGLYCTVSDRCQQGACLGAGERDCSALNTNCRLGVCREAQAACVAQAFEDGRPCESDARECTEDVCRAGVCDHAALPSGSACSEDGLSCTADVCLDGDCGHLVSQGCLIEGVCVDAGATKSGDPCLVCREDLPDTWSSSAGGEACDDGLFCTVDDACDDGQCLGGQAYDCSALAGPCADAVCVEAAGRCALLPKLEGQACPDDGDSCTTDRCETGFCVHDQVGSDCGARACGPSPSGCHDCGSCGAGYGCNELGQCDDLCVGVICAECQACVAGACVAAFAGSACSPDDSPCTSDLCAGGACVHAAVNDGTPCDDEDACTGVDRCGGGECIGEEPVVCQAINDCHAVGACDPATGLCSNPQLGAGTTCSSDGLACTDDLCVNGLCAHDLATGCLIDEQCYATGATKPGAPCLVCDPNAPRSWSAGNEGGACDDGLYCSVDDVCQAGDCVAGEARNCAHLEGICADAGCDEGLDACVPLPLPDGTSCSDDDNACTEDVCGGGECRHGAVTDGVPCDDGAWCSVNDYCLDGLCASGPPRDCSDYADLCSAGLCLEDEDLCEAAPLSQGTPCGGPTTCVAGVVYSPSACDGEGACGAAGELSCAPYAHCQDAEGCATSCEVDGDCVAEVACLGEVCRKNEAPVADAGLPAAVDEGGHVNLNAIASHDPDGDPLSYLWSQEEGLTVEFSDPKVAKPAFTAPYVEADTTLVFRLVVNDGWADSAPAFVNILVRDIVVPPEPLEQVESSESSPEAQAEAAELLEIVEFVEVIDPETGGEDGVGADGVDIPLEGGPLLDLGNGDLGGSGAGSLKRSSGGGCEAGLGPRGAPLSLIVIGLSLVLLVRVARRRGRPLTGPASAADSIE